MKEKIYMAVTCDKYELPLVVALSITELSRRLGIRSDCISRSISKDQPMIRKGFKFVQVEVEK